ncbi:MAG: thiamine-phosphate kinase [Burkholderiaceae bacterium]
MPASISPDSGAPVALTEFDVIERFFKRPHQTSEFVSLGVGDDCALLTPRPGEQWAVSTDTMTEGVHFFPDVDPSALGHKVLAVNLSDLAACGATPRCFFLALALPAIDQTWLEHFSRGLNALSDLHGCVLAGGDTTRSVAGVFITIIVIGTVPAGQALLRSGARLGHDIWVSGELGDAALALAFRRRQCELSSADAQKVLKRLDTPSPRVALGERLRGIATSTIDVSDGLLGDLEHVLQASGIGALVEWGKIPLSTVLQLQPTELQQQCALAGGDDYELLFTAPVVQRAHVTSAAAAAQVAVTRIGRVTAAGLAVVDAAGGPVETGIRGFDHFPPLGNRTVCIPSHVLPMNDAQTIEALAVRLGAALSAQHLTMATAESCTAGGVGYAVTLVPGSSAWYDRGFITYSNESKMQMLGVSAAYLRDFGAVSEPVARAMALGAMSHGAQVSLAVTGIAGPDGGSAGQPVGTVCFAWAIRRDVAAAPWVKAQTQHFAGNRAAVRTQSIVVGLATLAALLEKREDI